MELPTARGTLGLRLLAEQLAASLGGQVVAADLLAAAVLQAAMLSVAARYDAQEPGALARAAAGHDVSMPALRGLGVTGPSPNEGGSELVAALVLAALAGNAALASFAPLWTMPAKQATATQEAAAWLEMRGAPLEGAGAHLPSLFAAPAVASDSLQGQLQWVAEAWEPWLPPAVADDIGRVCGVIAEEQVQRGWGPGPIEGPGVGSDAGSGGPEGAVQDEQHVAFTEDKDWMPSLVLIAKQAFVWLHQLSREHGRSITRLDQIPDSEIDRLVARGFTGLWLIGLWERSSASQQIKRRMGNAEAEASAYALDDYAIAQRLGGEDAWRDLRDRAATRGLRLASDMVPNHVGIDGRWVVEHPDWFVQLPQAPYPGYRFDGPDLCEDPNIGVYLEDGYWDRSDAAVVFKRIDHRSGEARFIYHGNDGTQMPWNDTAQLDYLNAELREAVIQQILAVARRFPIIRFDAAMTLARRHVQRLWHPAPGSAGAVPSRAEHGVSAAAFEAAIPREFWREVVERVQSEVPDTLLLAEAFWMMEGYFVRSLGMHRVYNSAFMHMLRDEDNEGFRGMLKEVLETSPEVLERFVNFANNPDEESAASQFGTTDKYFGVATLMATLPGLPMFGHGQIEGYTEKYGMEYSRAYKDEVPDEGLVARHETCILPLLRRREEFCGAEHFTLHDLVTATGIDESVIAYSNRSDGSRSLVVFNNRWQETVGWLQGTTLSTALALNPRAVYGVRELATGQWFVRTGAVLSEQGFSVQLSGYGSHVFLDWRELADHDGRWSRLAAFLEGALVPDLDEALAELERSKKSQPDLDAPLEEEVDGVRAKLAAIALAEAVSPSQVDGGAGAGLEGEER